MKVRKGWFRISGNTFFPIFILGVKPVRDKVGGSGPQIRAAVMRMCRRGASSGTPLHGVYALRSEQEQSLPASFPQGPGGEDRTVLYPGNLTLASVCPRGYDILAN